MKQVTKDVLEISEKTLIPLSLVSVVAIIVFYATSMWNAVDSNAQKIFQEQEIRRETFRSINASLEKIVNINHTMTTYVAGLKKDILILQKEVEHLRSVNRDK